MSRRVTVVLLTLAVWAGTLLAFLAAVGLARRGPEGALGFGPRVAIVEVEGLIVDGRQVLEELKRHREDPLVRAVVLRIDSPGGVVGPTQEIHAAVRKLREAGKRVVASLGAVAASGGYYVAVAADEIVANPGTLTGSIGVMMQMANLEQLMKKVGVDWVVIKSGQFKDVGNVTRPMTAEERRLLQALLDDVHAQFVDAVSAGRRLPRQEVARLADGRIFSGAQARALGLVDALGGLEDAVNRAAALAGLPLPPRVVEPRRRLNLFELLGVRGRLPDLGRFAPQLPTFRTPLYLMD